MKQVAILCGGLSSEFSISLLSAETIIQHFPQEYDCHKIIVNENGWWLSKNDKSHPVNLTNFSVEIDGKSQTFDFAFIYIHGYPGEDGKIQAYFDFMQIPYLNSGVLASSLSFDKWYCNQFLKPFGVPVAESVLLRSKNNVNHTEIIQTVGLPCFVKPTDSGSSYGVSKVKTQNELQKAIDEAFQEGDAVVIESFLKGTEISCGVYRNKKGIVTLPPTEIVSENEYFDYEAKYEGKSSEITPARISSEALQKTNELTIKIYELIQLKGIARIDYMIVNDQPFLIEVNTIPGFSPASLVPQQLKYANISITDFLRELIEVEIK